MWDWDFVTICNYFCYYFLTSCSENMAWQFLVYGIQYDFLCPQIQTSELVWKHAPLYVFNFWLQLTKRNIFYIKMTQAYAHTQAYTVNVEGLIKIYSIWDNTFYSPAFHFILLTSNCNIKTISWLMIWEILFEIYNYLVIWIKMFIFMFIETLKRYTEQKNVYM